MLGVSKLYTHCGGSRLIKNASYRLARSSMLSISIIYEVLDERVRKLTYQQKAKAIEVYLNNVAISKLAKLINCSAC